MFILVCSLVQIYFFEYIWLTTKAWFFPIHRLHHYTGLVLILFHNLLLILAAYVHEWLEKLNFLWLKQIDDERAMICHQRDELQREISAMLPTRAVNYYLNSNSNLSLSQHYHFKYDRMGLLAIHFDFLHHQSEQDDFFQQIESLLQSKDTYGSVVMQKKASVKDLLFSTDIQQESTAMLSLVELLLEIEESLRQQFDSKVRLSACLHIGCVHEVFIHLEKYPKIDLWGDDIGFIRYLTYNIPAQHCLATKSVYHLLNDLYLFRTAGSIVSIDHQSTVYFFLGRLIGDNVFQVRTSSMH